MIGAVGGDTYGVQLRDSLGSYGVDTTGVRVLDDAQTGVALIVVDEPSGQNRIILSPQANHALRPHHFAELPAPRPDLLIMQLEIPFDTVLQALSAAREAGVPVLLNPAPARELPREAYAGLAHLVVNVRVGAVFLQKGVRNVIITLGGRGVYYATDDGKSALVDALKANVVDTTAAGDTFVGSYALSVVNSANVFDIDTAIRAANKASAITVSRRGAQVSIPWKDELQ
ncbi:Putative ribokinase [Beauveria bassiana D1-5]|uniref:Putative ribokinase n=1 Tax=Beauveria bassiana D1-5 TaxID=1245745 RepID=A0A0A2VSF2_BEABA|nr:Putative ribokinase [Beauveria bassiana D1-5]